MERSHTTAQNSTRNPVIDKNNPLQIDTMAKLFNCDYEEVLTALEKSNGTFISVFQVITSQKTAA